LAAILVDTILALVILLVWSALLGAFYLVTHDDRLGLAQDGTERCDPGFLVIVVFPAAAFSLWNGVLRERSVGQCVVLRWRGSRSGG
jgi:hypothetical protein